MAEHENHKKKVYPAIPKAGGRRVEAKISHLHDTEPKMPHKQKVAMASAMERRGRLGEHGEYEEAPPKPRMLRRRKA